jgi:hypothetical protein
MLTGAELAAQLALTPATLKTWRRAGLIRAHPYTDRPDYLFEPPGPSTPAKGAWKFARRTTPAAVNE